MRSLVLLLCIAVLASAKPRAFRNGRDGRLSKKILYPVQNGKVGDTFDIGSGKIVGGENAEPNEFPFILDVTIDDLYFCTGTIIDEQWIMTAGHCCDGSRRIEAVAGDHRLSYNDGTEETQVQSDDSLIFRHEDYNSITIDNDVCIVQMSFQMRPGIVETVERAQSEANAQVDTFCQIAGWGKRHDFDDGISDTLQKTFVPILSDHIAEITYGTDIDFTTKICIDSTGAHGTCGGDSGGPLLDTERKQVGLTSFGAAAGCEEGYPDCFTSIPSFNEWIDGIIAANPPN